MDGPQLCVLNDEELERDLLFKVGIHRRRLLDELKRLQGIQQVAEGRSGGLVVNEGRSGGLVVNEWWIGGE